MSEEREGQTEREREITQHIQMEQKAKGSKCCQPIPYSADSLEQAQSCTTTCPIYQLECQQILHLRSSPKSALPHDSTITLSAYTYSTLLSLTRQIPLHCQTMKKKNILGKYSSQNDEILCKLKPLLTWLDVRVSLFFPSQNRLRQRGNKSKTQQT